MFANCTNVESFNWTFYNCTSLIEIPEKLFINCKKVTDFYWTFYDCSNLTGNAPKLWERVENGELNEYRGSPSGDGCFYGCDKLVNYDDIPEYWKRERK